MYSVQAPLFCIMVIQQVIYQVYDLCTSKVNCEHG